MGKVIRSDELKGLTDSDLEYLASIPLHTIVDFRSVQEISASPDRMPATVKDRFELSINPGNLESVIMGSDVTSETLDKAMIDMYELMVTDSSCLAQYKEFFALIGNESNLPLLYHCTAGKDRTGVASALFLMSLGIDRETATDDYLASNQYVRVKYAPYLEQFPVLAPVLEVRGQYLDATFDRIIKDHGSIDKFLRDILGVDTERMREIYLYK